MFPWKRASALPSISASLSSSLRRCSSLVKHSDAISDFCIKTKVKKKMTQSRKQPVVLWLFLSSLLWQINRAPSFGTDQKIDYDVKKGVLLNALKLLNIRYSRSSALSLFQNLVLPSSINSSSARLHVHLALVAQRPCYAASPPPFCDIAADLKVQLPWFYHGWIGDVEAAEAAFQGINSIMVMLEWMSALFQPSCFFTAAAQLLRGGVGGVWWCAEVTAPTVSTWDQFIPNRAWTLINLSPPTALRIQFKGPVTDQNELAFFFQTTMAHLFWISCLVLFILDLSVCLCPGPAFHLGAAAVSRQKLSCFWDVCSVRLGDLIKTQISVFQFRAKISCLTSLWVCSTNTSRSLHLLSL